MYSLRRSLSLRCVKAWPTWTESSLSSKASQPTTKATTATTTPTTSVATRSDTTKGTNDSKTTSTTKYPFRQTAQRQEGFSYKQPTRSTARLATQLPPALALTEKSTASNPLGHFCTRGILLGVEPDPVAENEGSLPTLELQAFNGDTVQLTESVGLTINFGHQHIDIQAYAYIAYRLEDYTLPQLDFIVDYEDTPYQSRYDYGIPKNLRRGLEKTIEIAIASDQLVEVPYSSDISISPAFGKAKDCYVIYE
ncbi:hypothetical protein Pmar_PMAR010778 [Perkinsus marinus ATCC 50983]|uniref:Uncharacterized protein n=1 Tax=Perkinsus marinus (strain ATCC 50983 / TXsc) TaxID=423536 RepID=C5KNN0_PERM5|nr:hypothetical protein Pmar_PMAR010778 [Perkinsus marinus ATCC 50983]EER13911.1 hypothetical protein Pmar_PMAR010778 [Perkinsus marinus ATCC 50983]|eukprot:XP_002782116.1 hypothetical protein Pmar_PMAR010778 [Perkinsus marinus ATCC 50983]